MYGFFCLFAIICFFESEQNVHASIFSSLSYKRDGVLKTLSWTLLLYFIISSKYWSKILVFAFWITIDNLKLQKINRVTYILLVTCLTFLCLHLSSFFPVYWSIVDILCCVSSRYRRWWFDIHIYWSSFIFYPTL